MEEGVTEDRKQKRDEGAEAKRNMRCEGWTSLG